MKKSKLKRLLACVLSIVIAVSMMPAGSITAFASQGVLTGDGTAGNPYKIEDDADLIAFITEVTANPGICAVLETNIDASGLTLTNAPISSYAGVFDGGGFEISGLNITGGTGSNKAIFRTISSGGTVKNLKVSGSVEGGQYVGGIAAQNNGTIQNCSFSGSVTGSDIYVGGIAGRNSGDIIDCVNNGSVTGSVHVGGIAGQNGAATASGCGSIKNCDNTGKIEGTNATSGAGGTGGIAGTNFDTVDSCENSGVISGCKYAGGIVGYNSKNSAFDTKIINSNNKENVTGLQYIGGIAGYNFSTEISSCYNEGEIKTAENAVAKPAIGGIAGCTESTSASQANINNCYNTGIITGSDAGHRAGGIAGINNSSKATVERCYNIGTVGNSANPDNAGSISGSNAGTVKNCVYLKEPGVGSGKGQTEDMSMVSSDDLIKAETFASWQDFDIYWKIDVLLGRPILNNASESGNQGTEETPYEIPDLETLIKIRDLVADGNDFSGYYFTLTDNIDLNGSENNQWKPIGINNVLDFNGTFDGNNHTISGLFIKLNSNEYNQGLFGYIGNQGSVKNLTVTGEVTVTNQLAAGIAGANHGKIINCHSTVNVTGITSSTTIGGVVGGNYNTVEKCTYTSGTVSNTNDYYTGGISGLNQGTITNCYNSGNVIGYNTVGGITGNNINLVKNCYNSGDVSGETSVGELVGNSFGTVINSYYFSEKEETDRYGTGKTASQFASGEVAWLLNSGVTDGTQTFYQTCGEGLPEFTGLTVYQITNYKCPGDTTGETAYSNTDKGITGEHSFVSETATDKYLYSKGTCVSEALYYKSCEFCGEAHASETFKGEKDPNNHTNLVKTEAKPATHMTEGNIAYWYCDGCDKYFSDEAGTEKIDLEQTVVPKLTEHTADGTGWHSDENNHWNTCECGEKINETAHTFKWVTDKEATESETGLRHEQCAVCGYAKAAETIPAAGTNTDKTETGSGSASNKKSNKTQQSEKTNKSYDSNKETKSQSGSKQETTANPKTGENNTALIWLLMIISAGILFAGKFNKKYCK